MSAVRASSAVFREAFLHADTLDPDGDFNKPEARWLRYQIFWAHYQNDAYRKVNRWATKFKADYGLYKYTRGIYNPAYRLAAFWQTHLMGGQLGLDADGAATASGALPIATDNTALRASIGQLWRESNWQINKDIFTLWGAVLGDVALRVVDDTRRGRVYLQRVHPGTLVSVTLDPYGNVKAYEIQETRPHPETGKDATYTETAERDGDDVVFATFLNDQPYDWRDKESIADDPGGAAAEWREPYGFVPLVVCQHNNVGMDWGWAELHPALGKVREVDDLASKASDHIRKSVDPVWLFAGMRKGENNIVVNGAAASTDRPEPGREELGALYAQDSNAKPHALVANLNLQDALAHINGIAEELERDFPELKFEVMRMGGNVSAEALRTAQEPVEDKVAQRRTNYDDALRRAQQMAVAIGGFRGYAGYAGFNLESYGTGNLEHAIGPRPVFGVGLDERLKRAESKRKLLVPAPQLWKELDYSEEDIATMESGAEYQAYLQGLGMDLTANG